MVYMHLVGVVRGRGWWGAGTRYKDQGRRNHAAACSEEMVGDMLRISVQRHEDDVLAVIGRAT